MAKPHESLSASEREAQSIPTTGGRSSFGIDNRYRGGDPNRTLPMDIGSSMLFDRVQHGPPKAPKSKEPTQQAGRQPTVKRAKPLKPRHVQNRANSKTPETVVDTAKEPSPEETRPDQTHRLETPEPYREPATPDTDDYTNDDYDYTADEPSSTPSVTQKSRSSTRGPAKSQPKTESSWADELEADVDRAFQPGIEGAAKLKKDLEAYVDEGGSPILAALGATVLDISVFSMEFTKGTPKGILDARNLGEGAKKNTLEGYLEDADRLLNIIPQGKTIRAAGNVVDALQIGHSLGQGDAAGAIMRGVVGRAGNGKKKKKKKRKWVFKHENGGAYSKVKNIYKKDRNGRFIYKWKVDKNGKRKRIRINLTEKDHIPPMDSFVKIGLFQKGDAAYKAFFKKASVARVDKDKHRVFPTTGTKDSAQAVREEGAAFLKMHQFEKAYDHYADMYKQIYPNDKQLAKALEEGKAYYMSVIVPELKKKIVKADF